MPTDPLPPRLTPTTAVAAGAGPPPQPVGEVAVVRLPERLQNLTRPVVLSGTAVGETFDGGLRVRTQAGEVVIQATPGLPRSGPITLQIPAGTPPARALVFAPPPGPSGAAPPPSSPLAPPVSGGPAAPILSPGRALPAGPPAPGTLIAAVVVGATPAGALEPGPGNPALGNPALGNPALAVGNRLALRVLTVTPASGEFASSSTESGEGLLPAGTISGTVTGATTTGESVLTSADGRTTLILRTALAPGARVMAALADPAALIGPHAPAEPGPTASASFPALRDTLTALADLDQPAVHAAIESTVPRPNRRLAAAVGFFLGTVRHGDAREWLGEPAVAALDQAGRSDATAALEREFTGLSRQASDPLPGDWRSFTIPLLDQQQLSQINLFVRRFGDDEEGDGKGGADAAGSRFIVEVELSRLGPLRLDGLLHRQSFNLIVRSRRALSEDLRQELREAFGHSIEIAGFQGGLSFQIDGGAWLRPAVPPPGLSGPSAAGGRGGVIA